MERATLKEQIYNYDKEYSEKMTRLEKDKNILPANKTTIKDFLQDKRAEGISKARETIILQYLTRIGRHTNTAFNNFDESAMRELMRRMGEKNYSAWTLIGTRSMLKQLMKRLGKPEEVYSWMKSKRPPNRIEAEDLLTEAEMSAMVAATDEPMWKALLATLFETGCRPGELMAVRIGDLTFNGSKCRIRVGGKTEIRSGLRSVFSYHGFELLKNWLNVHPKKDDVTSPLWLTKSNEPLQVHTLNIIYKKISNRARIEKRNWPYLARHTRLTQIYRDHGAVLGSKMAGHIHGSKEIATYVHLSEADIENALDAANGFAEEAKTPQAQECTKCEFLNGYGQITCSKCGGALNSAGVLVVETERESKNEAMAQIGKLMENPKVMAFLETLASADKDRVPRALDALKSQ